MSYYKQERKGFSREGLGEDIWVGWWNDQTRRRMAGAKAHDRRECVHSRAWTRYAGGTGVWS